ncbi:MAG: FRG domain-containing protein [Flavobacteriaceae bacterium]
MQHINYKSYFHFKSNFKKDIISRSPTVDFNALLFRGQSDSDWKLVSAFDRVETDKSKYDSLLYRFKNICEKYNFQEELLETSKKDINVLAAYGQHYGLPTRLLDWTKSYYFGAFFAFSGIKSLEVKTKKCTIWCINPESELVKKAKGLDFIELSTNKYNYRIKNQLGFFTLSKHTEDSINEYETAVFKKYDIDDLLWKIDIQYNLDDIDYILEDLNDMGISYSIVYPDIDGYILESIHTENIKIE